MTRRVETTPVFERDLKRLAKRYRGIRQDLESLILDLQSGELPGDRIPSAKHPVYKVRLPNSDAKRGKSGGYRVIYYQALENRLVLLTIYSKSDQGDISNREIRDILRTSEGE